MRFSDDFFRVTAQENGQASTRVVNLLPEILTTMQALINVCVAGDEMSFITTQRKLVDKDQEENLGLLEEEEK